MPYTTIPPPIPMHSKWRWLGVTHELPDGNKRYAAVQVHHRITISSIEDGDTVRRYSIVSLWWLGIHDGEWPGNDHRWWTHSRITPPIEECIYPTLKYNLTILPFCSDVLGFYEGFAVIVCDDKQKEAMNKERGV